jgi:hypothetical protein
MPDVQPGDLLVCRNASWAAKLIQIGAVLRGVPAFNHVAVAHHTDASGTLWAIEGRPGGVGWVDAGRYIRDPFTISNVGQPKTDAQRAAVTATVEKLLTTPYDWASIVEDAGIAFGLTNIWHERVGGTVPGHIVCSSLAAYAYDKAGLTAPTPDDYRHVTPGMWCDLIERNRWQK